MKILGICASYGLHVSVIDNNKVVFLHKDCNESKSDNLLSIIDAGLASCNLKFSDIDAIATCVGPGSFTGSRVAISLVKGLFMGQNKKLIAFESFDCFGQGDVALSGFGKFIYVKRGNQKSCVEIDSVKDFSGVTDSKNVADVLGINVAEFDMTKVIIEKANKGEFVTIENLAPVYLRASQAEIEREKKNDRR